MRMPHDWTAGEIAEVIVDAATYGFIAIGMLLVFAMTFPRNANAIECRDHPDRTRSQPRWAWREIDDRKCWYPGTRLVSKSILHWPEERPALKHIDPPLPDTPKQSILFPNLSPSDQRIAKELLARAPMTAWPVILDIDNMEVDVTGASDSEFNVLDAEADDVPLFETRWRDVPANKNDKLDVERAFGLKLMQAGKQK